MSNLLNKFSVFAFCRSPDFILSAILLPVYPANEDDTEDDDDDEQGDRHLYVYVHVPAWAEWMNGWLNGNDARAFYMRTNERLRIIWA